MSATRSTAFVTGASGFLGTHLVRTLRRRYGAVHGIDLVSTDDASGAVLVGDVRDVLPTLGRYDAVFHLAATVGGRSTIERRPLAVAENLALDVAFFRYVARTKPARAVYMSSSAVYPAVTGDGADASFDESDVDPTAAVVGRPDGTYGWVKLVGEHLAHVVRDRHGIAVTCYRPFTVYGSGQTADYPLPAIVGRALRREDPLTVWGSGTQIRDFVHVDDAVAAIVSTHDAATAPAVLNLCSGVGTTFATIARLAARAVGYEPSVVGDASKPGGVQRRVGSPRRLARFLTPRTAVADGIRELVERMARR